MVQGFGGNEVRLKPRPRYLSKLVRSLDNGAIKVVIGMRRCGKSSLLMMLAEHLRQQGIPPDHIITANFESSRFFDVEDYRDLTSWLHGHMQESGHYYVLLDELQLVARWGKTVNAVCVDADADVYLTGSNAYLLSSQLATPLSGRCEEVRVYPLSFRAFMRYADISDRQEALARYLEFGGLPPAVDQGTDRQLARTMLSGIYNTVVVRDVAQHVQVRNMAVFNDVARFLADTTGSNVAVTKIERRLAGAHRKTAGGTVERYVQGPVDAYLFLHARRYDVKDGAYLQGGESIIRPTQESAICYWTFPPPILDSHWRIWRTTNCARGFTVRVGKVGVVEVDFMASRGDIGLAIEATASILDPQTRPRELASLRKLAGQAVSEGLRRLVITYDTVGLGEVDGIGIVNVLDWLME